MRKLSDELAHLVQSNPFLQRGVREDLFNGAALARFVQPLLQARLKREVSVSSIAMALSRLQPEAAGEGELAEDFRVDEMAVRRGLSLVSFVQTPEIRRALGRVYRALQRKELFATLTEGMREATLIYEPSKVTAELEQLGEPLAERCHVGCIGLSFPTHYGETPGFLYSVFQQLFFQGLNVIEIASTSRELLVYLDEKDLKLGFDTLFERFGER